MKTRIIASIVTAAFIFTQCGIGLAGPIIKEGRNLRPNDIEGKGSAVGAVKTALQKGNPAGAVGIGLASDNRSVDISIGQVTINITYNRTMNTITAITNIDRKTTNEYVDTISEDHDALLVVLGDAAADLPLDGILGASVKELNDIVAEPLTHAETISKIINLLEFAARPTDMAGMIFALDSKEGKILEKQIGPAPENAQAVIWFPSLRNPNSHHVSTVDVYAAPSLYSTISDESGDSLSLGNLTHLLEIDPTYAHYTNATACVILEDIEQSQIPRETGIMAKDHPPILRIKKADIGKLTYEFLNGLGNNGDLWGKVYTFTPNSAEKFRLEKLKDLDKWGFALYLQGAIDARATGGKAVLIPSVNLPSPYTTPEEEARWVYGRDARAAMDAYHIALAQAAENLNKARTEEAMKRGISVNDLPPDVPFAARSTYVSATKDARSNYYLTLSEAAKKRDEAVSRATGAAANGALPVTVATAQSVGVTMSYIIGQYKVTMKLNGDLEVADTTSDKKPNTVTIDKLKSEADGRAVVVVDEDGAIRARLVNILRGMKVFKKIVEADTTAQAKSIIEQLKADYASVFVLNSSAATTDFGIDNLAVINLGVMSSIDNTAEKTIENIVYARLAIFV